MPPRGLPGNANLAQLRNGAKSFQRAVRAGDAGVVLVAVISVPFGLAVGALAPHDLEGMLILIGVVGIQLTLESTQTVSKLLPFWGPQRLMQHATTGSVPIGAAIPVGLGYGLALLALAAYLMARRAPRAAYLTIGDASR